ncbi:hypothetical protein ACFL2Z_05495 [Candidatus Eisenbacteria bacterium]|uniref:Uncharacterized protein n=1 Tax=Eiseniibacteriota bacterium TaxID=2212470 RepID=A0ABV6YQL5_UNCEI
MKKMTYGKSGVDLKRYGRLLKNIKGNLKKHSESSGSGTFAGLLGLDGTLKKGRMVVASVDGVREFMCCSRWPHGCSPRPYSPPQTNRALTMPSTSISLDRCGISSAC